MRDSRLGGRPRWKMWRIRVAYFASEEAEYVTGQVMNVSGGWML